MAAVTFSPQGRQDLFDILTAMNNIAGVRTARSYEVQFQAAAIRFSETPGIGALRAEFGPNTRIWTVEPYVIFYDGEPKGEAVTVLRILHGRRKISEAMIADGRKPAA